VTTEPLSSVVEAQLASWDELPRTGRHDDEWLARLATLSARAHIAVMAATLEWITPSSPRALEAAWAAVIDRRYVASFESVSRAFAVVYGGLDVAWQGALETSAAAIVELVNRVGGATDSERFDAWLVAVLDRLDAISPRRERDHVGDVPPRAVFELAEPFDAATTTDRVQRFLSSLRRGENNPFLTSPDQLVEWGLAQPYWFSAKHDRATRLEAAVEMRRIFHGY